MTLESKPAGPSTLRDKINRLFEVIRPPNEPARQWQNKELVAACKAAGRDLSESHLSELRRGVKDNPSVRVLDNIAWFFSIRPGYFIDPQVEREVEAQLLEREAKLRADLEMHSELAEAERELREAMSTAGITGVANRAGSVKTKDRIAMIRVLLEVLREDSTDDEAN